MKITQRIPSYAALAAAIAVIGFAARHGKLLEPDRILLSLTFAGVAILLWPSFTNQPTQK